MTSDTPPTSTPPTPARPLALTFLATPAGYFRVWLPGACLTWLTLGFYSSWAAVRRSQYLAAHTELDGIPFRYQARAWPLLLGRACVLLALGLLGIAVRPDDARPWVLAACACLLPFVLVRLARFVASSHSYCGQRGEFTGSARSFFFAVTPVLIAAALGSESVVEQLHRHLRPFSDAHPVLVVLPYAALGFWVLVSIEVAVRQLVAEHTRWGGLSFDLRLETGAMVWLHVTNGLASLLSFGLLLPWAEIRTRRYWLSRLRVLEPEARGSARAERYLRRKSEEHAAAVPTP